MRFDISNYKGKYVMHCKTEEEAVSFCEHLNNIGKRTCWCDKYNGNSLWNRYGDKLTINFNEGFQSNIDYYHKNNYTILEWEDFMKTFTKADLKSGDIVLRRDGTICVVFAEVNALGRQDGFDSLNNYNNDLTNKVDQSLDIIAVRRPREPRECNLGYFNREYVTLIYDRERDETEEMTLEQVCKLLGKNIKIIK